MMAIFPAPPAISGARMMTGSGNKEPIKPKIMKYDIYLYEITDNGKICGLWWERSEFRKFWRDTAGRWFLDRDCRCAATPDNIYSN